MNVKVGGIALAMVLVLGMTGAVMAREARGAKGYPKGFHQPAFNASARVSGRDGPFVWPVADRYRAESRPFYGRAY